MKAQLLSLMVVASLIAMAVSTPTIFMGGDFLGLAGTGVWDRNGRDLFAAYNVNTNQWSTAIQQPNLGGVAKRGSGPTRVINDIDDAGNGVFAVGDFLEVTDTGFFSHGVAFFDGTKWCAVRESINGIGHSVLCDTDTSCWVAGSFNSIHNLPSGPVDNAVQNFVRYTFDTAGNEWVVDPASLVWNRLANTSNVLPATTALSSLYLVTSGSNQFFFTYNTATNTIWRGASVNAGWYPWATTASVSTSGGAIADWTVAGSSVYVVLNSLPEFTSTARAAAVSAGGAVTATCNPCTATVLADWADLVGSVNGSKYQQFSRIAVASGGGTQYLLTFVDPDSGSSNDYIARWRVLSHSGTGGATLTEVGQPFKTDNTNDILRLFVDQNSNVVAVGAQEGNLFYPPNTDDDSGAVVDRRTTDRFNSIAVFNGSSWSQAFGGGFRAVDPFNNFREAFNSRTNEWFFTGPYSATYDVHADSAAFFDNDEALTTPFFPLFTHKLHNRDGADAAVYDIVCKEADCAAVYVGGAFQFHGVDTYGSIAEVTVDQSGNPAAATVGGGLWFIDEDNVIDDPTLQATEGKVYALARENNFLYAAGRFGRGSRPESPDFVCLNNIAKIDIDADAPTWVDLNGGCDNDVYDLIFWNGQLVAAGDFVQCGGGRVVNYVASYNYLAGESASWSSLNNGVDATAYSLEVFQDRLIAGGDFAFAGGLPVTGVASWDGRKWRALLPACTDDCTSGLDFYFTNLVSPSNVYDLRTDLSGDALWGRVIVGPATLLAKWQYVDGDLGRWTATGDEFTIDGTSEKKGHRIANDGSDSIVLAAGVSPSIGKALYGSVGLYHGGIDNWVQEPRTVVAENVFVIRGPQAGSASTLSSPLSALLSLL